MILSLWAEIWFFDFPGLGRWRIFKICAFRGSFLCKQRLGKEFLDADEVGNLLYQFQNGVLSVKHRRCDMKHLCLHQDHASVMQEVSCLCAPMSSVVAYYGTFLFSR